MPAMVFPCTQSSRIRLSAICSARDATAHAASILQGERNLCRSGPRESARQLWEARQQRKKNREQFEANRPEYENSIRRLMERIQNTLLVDLQPVPEKSRQGKMMGRQSGGLCTWKTTVCF